MIGVYVIDDAADSQGVARRVDIRHQLLPNGRYDEAPGNRKSAYQGRYTIKGNRIDYVDDIGFTADGKFIDGVPHHAGMVLRRDDVRSR